VYAFVTQNVLLSDTSSSDEDDDDVEMSLTDAGVKEMLREHVRHKRYQRQFAADKEVKYQPALLSFSRYTYKYYCY